MTDPDVLQRLKEATLTPARINPYTLPPEQHGWRGLTNPAAPKRKIYTILHNEQVLVTLLMRFPGESGPFGSRHYHDSGELSIRFEGDLTPIVGWSPPGDPHLHAQSRNRPAELRDTLSKVAQDSDLSPELTRVAGQLEQVLQLPPVAEWLEGLFRPEPRLSVAVDVLFPPFTTYVAQPDGGWRKVIGQWYD